MKAFSKGTALAVVLVLLAGLSALTLAAAAAAITALALTGHQQGAAIAMEAAEAGIAHALRQASEQPGPAVAGPLPHHAGGTTVAHFVTRTIEMTGNGALPAGFSTGEFDTGFGSQHYLISSIGRSTRNAQVSLEQGFYVVVPNP